MKLTVIVPVHNSETYLEECLESLASQSCQDFEALCIDDYSVDKTKEIIERYVSKNERFKLIEDPNGSYGHKINVGISLAQGEYICILESDDLYYPDTLECFLKIIDVFSPDFVDGDYMSFCQIGEFRHERRTYKYEYPEMYNALQLGDSNLRALWYKTSGIWTGAYKKSFLVEHNIRFNESPGAAYQDTSFKFLVTTFAKSVYHIGRTLYYYRMDNVLSSVKNQSKITTIIGEYEYLRKCLVENNIINDEIWEHFYIWKYTSYIWNMKRLTKNRATYFGNYVIDEMECDKAEIDKIKKMGIGEFLELSRFKKNPCTYIDDLSKRTEWIADNKQLVVDVIRMCQHKNTVIVGTREWANKLYEILSKKEKECICCVCDSEQIEDDFRGFEICSIEDANREFSDAHYVIADEVDAESKLNALYSLGVSSERISVFDGALDVQYYLIFED